MMITDTYNQAKRHHFSTARNGDLMYCQYIDGAAQGWPTLARNTCYMHLYTEHHAKYSKARCSRSYRQRLQFRIVAPQFNKPAQWWA